MAIVARSTSHATLARVISPTIVMVLSSLRASLLTVKRSRYRLRSTMTIIPAEDVEWSCACGYHGKYMQVHMHRINSRKPECQGSISFEAKVPEKAAQARPEPAKLAGSRWVTEDSDEPEDEEEFDDAPTSPVTSSSGLGSSESSSTKKPTITPLDVSPTDSLHRIKITVENLALYDTDRGEGYTGSVEAWVNDVIAYHFQSCLCIELRAVQLIPIESGGS